MAGVVLAPTSVSVTPGGEAVCTVTIRNGSTIVESYAVTVLGDAAAWATVTPATVSLFPGADGAATIHFRPPRHATAAAGPMDFAVRVAATQSPDDSVVEEAVLTVEPFVEISARITPRTSEAKRKARHVVTVENRGNAPVTVQISASDPDEALAFQPTPPTVTIAPGETGASSIALAARTGFARGPAQHHPFQATVDAPGSLQPTVLDANFVQKAGMPSFIPALAAVAVVAVVAAIVVPGLLKDKDKGGTFSLSSAANTTTSVAAAAAPAAAEGEEAEAEAEVTSGGGEAAPVTTAPPKSSGPAAASTGGQAVATTAPPPTTASDDEPTATTAPEAQPVTSTTAATTTTTTPPPYAKFNGTWKNQNASTNFQPQMIIRNDATNVWVHGYGACSPSYCDWGEAPTPLSDASDNVLNVTFNQSNGTLIQKLTYNADGTISVRSDKYTTSGAYWYGSNDVFKKV